MGKAGIKRSMRNFRDQGSKKRMTDRIEHSIGIAGRTFTLQDIKNLYYHEIKDAPEFNVFQAMQIIKQWEANGLLEKDGKYFIKW